MRFLGLVVVSVVVCGVRPNEANLLDNLCSGRATEQVAFTAVADVHSVSLFVNARSVGLAFKQKQTKNKSWKLAVLQTHNDSM